MNLKVKTSVGAAIFLCRDFFRDRPARKIPLMDSDRATDEFGTILAERERERERERESTFKCTHTRREIEKRTHARNILKIFKRFFIHKYICETGKCILLLRRFYINDYALPHLFMKNSLPME
jgi:hypothetical protein